MIPAKFVYVRPSSVDEAVAALAQGGEDAKVLAGGLHLGPVGGRIVEQGPADEVLGQPTHPYTQALLSSIPADHPSQRGSAARIPAGGSAHAAAAATSARWASRSSAAPPRK